MTWFPAIFILRLFVAFAIDSAVYVCGLVWGAVVRVGTGRAIFVCKIKLSNLAEKAKQLSVTYTTSATNLSHLLQTEVVDSCFILRFGY
jgi:hypothetical protein